MLGMTVGFTVVMLSAIGLYLAGALALATTSAAVEA
jgi:hypothetical protein